MNPSTLTSPPDGHTFVCEVEGRLRSMPIDQTSLTTFTNSVKNYPNVSVTREMAYHGHTLARESSQQIFLPTREPLSKRVVSTWYQHGLRPSLELIAVQGGGRVGTALRYLFTVLDKLGGLKKTVSTEHHNKVFSPIRMLVWHPHMIVVAVAAWDDSIRLFAPEESLCCILKTKLQRSVSCLAWRPYTSTTLVVGCETGVIIWNRDPNNKISMVCTAFLPSPNKAPVTSLEWDPQGTVLLTASSSHGEMHVWNADLEQFVRLPRKSRHGTSLVHWSPSRIHLMTASKSNAFHLWDRRDWSCERWTVASGYVSAACFSPCGSVLLFTSSEEPLVFALMLRATMSLVSGAATGQQSALLVLDNSLTETEKGVRLGGLIKSMVWDPNARYLAIISHQSELVSVFCTKMGTQLNITPYCVINGKMGESPSNICFQPGFQEGSQLTIVWSSGRVQYFPFIYDKTDSLLKPLQDVSYMINLLSSSQPPSAVPVTPQSPSTFGIGVSSPVYQPTLSSPVFQPANQQPQSPYTPLQSTFAPALSSLRTPFASTPQPGTYTPQLGTQSPSPSPVLQQQTSFYTSPAVTTPQQHDQACTPTSVTPRSILNIQRGAGDAPNTSIFANLTNNY